MGHQGFASRTRTKRRYQNKHIELGLCKRCNKKALKGHKLCAYHIRKEKEWRNKSNIFWRNWMLK